MARTTPERAEPKEDAMEAFKYQVIVSTPTLAMAVRVSADREHVPGLTVLRDDIQLEDSSWPETDDADACFSTAFPFEVFPTDIAEALQGGDTAYGEEVVVGQAKPGVSTADELLSAALRVPAGSVSSHFAPVPAGRSLWSVFADQARFAVADFAEATLWEWATEQVDSAGPSTALASPRQRWQPSRKRRK
jgi:hypothetical protein